MSNMQTLRNNLFDSMTALREGKISVSTANAIAGTGQVLINSLKVEIDARKAAKNSHLPTFIEPKLNDLLGGVKEELTEDEREAAAQDLLSLIPEPGYSGSVTVHRMKESSVPTMGED